MLSLSRVLNLFLWVCFVGSFCSCNTAPNDSTPTQHATGSGKMVFERQVIDLGLITSGDVVGAKFKFHNIGNAQLVIKNVQPDCGCTKVVFPQYPVPADNVGAIDVQFDTSGLNGYQYKTVKVFVDLGVNKIELIKLAFTANIQ